LEHKRYQQPKSNYFIHPDHYFADSKSMHQPQ